MSDIDPRTEGPQLGRAIADVTELTQKIVKDEIELAKAEVSEKVTKLAKGAAVGAAAGVFAVFGLIYLLHALSWGLAGILGDKVWLGYLVTALIIFILGGVAGFLAAKFLKSGAPPTPQMAIEEAQLVRQTLQEAAKDND